LNDYSAVKFGRSGVEYDHRRRIAATSLLESLPPAPLAVDNTMGMTEYGMLGNDTLGDCTMAGLAHHQQIITLDGGKAVCPSTEQVISAYSQYCGYVPGNPATDNGGVELNILTQIEGSRNGVFGKKLLGYISPDPKNLDHVKKAIAYFRCIYMGCLLPGNFRTQPVWSVVADDGGIEGGHCMVNAKYDPDQIEFITWGMKQPATWAWWLKYVDECHVLVWDATLKLFPYATQQTILNMMHELN
jgi:hypothetical protein